MLLSVLCFGLVPGAARLISGGNAATFLGIGVGAVCYLAGLWWLRDTLLLTELIGLRRNRPKQPPKPPPGTESESDSTQVR